MLLVYLSFKSELFVYYMRLETTAQKETAEGQKKSKFKAQNVLLSELSAVVRKSKQQGLREILGKHLSQISDVV